MPWPTQDHQFRRLRSRQLVPKIRLVVKLAYDGDVKVIHDKVPWLDT
jgi:hypothetical protein